MSTEPLLVSRFSHRRGAEGAEFGAITFLSLRSLRLCGEMWVITRTAGPVASQDETGIMATVHYEWKELLDGVGKGRAGKAVVCHGDTYSNRPGRWPWR